MKNDATETTSKVREAANLLPELVSGFGVSGFGVSGFEELQFSELQQLGLIPLLKKREIIKTNAFDHKGFFVVICFY